MCVDAMMKGNTSSKPTTFWLPPIVIEPAAARVTAGRPASGAEYAWTASSAESSGIGTGRSVRGDLNGFCLTIPRLAALRYEFA